MARSGLFYKVDGVEFYGMGVGVKEMNERSPKCVAKSALELLDMQSRPILDAINDLVKA